MIRHVVMFRFTPDVDAAHIAALSAAFDALPALIRELRSYRHGPDLGRSDGNFDYVVVADFDTFDDFLTYRAHPDHQALIRGHLDGHVAERAAVQYVD